MEDGRIFSLSINPNSPYKLGDFGLNYKIVIMNFMYVNQIVTISKSGGRPVGVNLPAVTALMISSVNIDTISSSGSLGGYLVTGPFQPDFSYISLVLGYGQDFSANGVVGTSKISLYTLINNLISTTVTFVDELVMTCTGATFNIYGNSFMGNGYTVAVGQTLVLKRVAPKGINIIGSSSSSAISLFGNNAAIGTGSAPSFIVGAEP